MQGVPRVSRDRTPYGQREVRAMHVAGALDVSEPVEGWYKIKLGRNTILRAVHVYYGPPCDPVTGEELQSAILRAAERVTLPQGPGGLLIIGRRQK